MGVRLGRPQGAVSFFASCHERLANLEPTFKHILARSPRAGAAFLLLLGLLALGMAIFTEGDTRKSSVPWISKSYFGFEAHAGRHTTATLRFDVRGTDVDPRIVVGTLNS